MSLTEPNGFFIIYKTIKTPGQPGVFLRLRQNEQKILRLFGWCVHLQLLGESGIIIILDITALQNKGALL